MKAKRDSKSLTARQDWVARYDAMAERDHVVRAVIYGLQLGVLMAACSLLWSSFQTSLRNWLGYVVVWSSIAYAVGKAKRAWHGYIVRRASADRGSRALKR